MPFGVKLTRSQVLYRAAQDTGLIGCKDTCSIFRLDQVDETKQTAYFVA